MRALAAALALSALAAGPAGAQAAAETGTGAVLRALDRMSGTYRDITVPTSATASFGRIEIDHAECRYPAGNPAGDAYALLRVRDTVAGTVPFTGWMIASAPALNALDHPRYDVWLLRCTTS